MLLQKVCRFVALSFSKSVNSVLVTYRLEKQGFIVCHWQRGYHVFSRYIRAGIMEFTCNSALSAVHRTQFLKMPWNVRHTDGDFATTRFEIRVQCRAFTRFHCHPSRPLRPTLLRSSHWLLNVRQVIYTRGFTAREILRKTDRTETGVWCVATSRWGDMPSKNEKLFFTAGYELCYDEW